MKEVKEVYLLMDKLHFIMNGITLWMAFVDAIPVVIFLFAALKLMKDFSEDIKEKGLWNYALLCSGAFMLFGGAILKVAWKTLYALNICDYYTLSESFFPMQTIGFAMMAMSIIGYLCKTEKGAKIGRYVFGIIMLVVCTFFIVMFAKSGAAEATLEANQVFPYESHMPFLLGTFIGFMTVQISLMILAFKRSAKAYSIAFLFSMIFMIAEAIVGSMFNGTPEMHWVAQFIHIFAEIGLLIGATGIYKAKK